MQYNGDVDFIKEVEVGKLPFELVVEGFEEAYSGYLKHHEAQSLSVWLPAVVSLIAVLLLLVGGITIVVGPRTVSVSALGGPTFLQFIQLFPGPIFTVGILLFGAGQYLLRFCGAALTPVLFLLTHYKLRWLEEPDDSEGLSMVYVSGSLFMVSCES